MHQETDHQSADEGVSNLDEGPRLLSDDGRDRKAEGEGEEGDFHGARLKERGEEKECQDLADLCIAHLTGPDKREADHMGALLRRPRAPGTKG